MSDAGLQVAVVGGGTIGLSVAWQLALTGATVTVYDPAPGSGASWVAAGMLAPYSEAWAGDEQLLRQGHQSLGMWADFADRLAPHATQPLITSRGTVWFATDTADADELRSVASTVAATIDDDGMLTLVSPSAATELVPGAAPRVRLAGYAPTELAVDNRAVHSALRAACAAAGVTFELRRVADPGQLVADAVVVCAGAASTELVPGLAMRPVKGEVVRLRCNASTLPPPAVTVRARVRGRQVYVVPRADGVVVGATQYEDERNLAPRVGPVIDLLSDAFEVMPFLREYELLEVTAGLRPVTRDNLPIIAQVDQGVFVATGHGRGGVLLAPFTAAKATELLMGVGTRRLTATGVSAEGLDAEGLNAEGLKWN